MGNRSKKIKIGFPRGWGVLVKLKGIRFLTVSRFVRHSVLSHGLDWLGLAFKVEKERRRLRL